MNDSLVKARSETPLAFRASELVVLSFPSHARCKPWLPLSRMALREYAAKRDFTKTSEPRPKTRTRRRKSTLLFVVQKHAASHLHYDFRLELNGVLKSWAVPKGPSLNPQDKRLAMQTEDHPYDYGGFEGTIPKGQYGGGTVMLWDVGTWTPLDDNPQDALHRGNLKFELHGKKLKGSWALVRAFGRDVGSRKNSWLLMKHKDASSRIGKLITETATKSVKTGRTLEEIAADPHSPIHHSNHQDSTEDSPLENVKVVTRRASRSSTAATLSRRDNAVLDLAGTVGARQVDMPRNLRLQLCTLVESVPEGEEWLHEIKFDGYRFLAYKSGGHVRLESRRGLDWTSRFSPIAEAIAALPNGELILDGEAAVRDETGRTSFQDLQQALKSQRFERLSFYVFDLLYADGYDLRELPLITRKDLLHRLVPTSDSAQRLVYSDHILGSGDTVRLNACRMGLEGIVSKRIDAAYVETRSNSWLKIKCGWRQEFVIVGSTPPEGSRSSFGSLLLAAHDESKRLIYTGKVGTGFDEKLLSDIGKRLKSSATDATPLDVDPPRDQVRRARWVKPRLVAEVAFTEWTKEGRLRHPSFQGLREDKDWREVRIERKAASLVSDLAEASSNREARESPVHPNRRKPAKAVQATSAAGHTTKRTKQSTVVEGIEITHPERVLYPDVPLTKLDLAHYYENIAEFILPYIVNRPLATVRCPGGREKQCFFQKHVHDIFTAPVKPLRVKEKDTYEDLIRIDSKAGLVKLAQLSVLEIHPWGSSKDTIEQPDVLTFDLDPADDVTFAEVKAGAKRVRELLTKVGLGSFLKTSGGKGLHVVVPLTPSASWSEAREFAEAVARLMADLEPEKYTANMSKAKRVGKIFVDYLRNGRGATSVAPYSPRARQGAPVSMPIRWEDLSKLESPAQFTVTNVPAHIVRRRSDPWATFSKLKQRVPKLK